MLKVCRKTRIRDVEQGDDKLISKKEAINQKPAENDLKKMDFVDDKYIENFETLENKAISLELRLEDRTRELADLILNNNRNNLPEDRINKFEPRVEDRTKMLEDKLDLVLNNNTQTEERIKTFEDMMENRTKTLEDKLDNILYNNIRADTRLNLELKLEQRRTTNLEDKLNTILDHLKSNK